MTLNKFLPIHLLLIVGLFLTYMLNCNIAIASASNLPKGYLLFQDVATYSASKYGAISTEGEAERIFSQMQTTKVGVEFISLFYDAKDIVNHINIAKVAKRYNIDTWESSTKLVENIRAFGDFSPQYQASVMKEDGTIYQATLNGYPLFDVLNKEAVTWFVSCYKQSYLSKIKGLVNGYFFNEDVLHYFGNITNNKRPDYWKLPVYSRSVLTSWREYCQKHHVTFNGVTVDKFPVHDPKMVVNGKGLTQYYPGYKVPAEVFPGDRFVTLPRTEGVWTHWYDFVCSLFASNWIGNIASTVSEVNKNEPNWYGVIYFGLHSWSLPYEEIEDSEFSVPKRHRWGAWGRQRGLDLGMVSRLPNIDIIICETYPPISAHLDFYAREFSRIANGSGKKFGIMLHRDDKWRLDNKEEDARWDLINKYNPSVIARYPLKHTLPWNEHYSMSGENIFKSKLFQYRENKINIKYMQ